MNAIDTARLREWSRGVARELKDFVFYIGERFVSDNCLNSAATLSYTTLLSLVPVFAVSISVLALFPVFDHMIDRIQDFVFTNLVPASGAEVRQSLQHFAHQTTGLTIMGTTGLVLSAVLMMAAIDRTLNQIWRVRDRRRPIQSVLVYWTVITLGPLFVAVSFAASSYLFSLASLDNGQTVSRIKEIILNVTPFLSMTAGFTFLYSAVPNRRVPVRQALIGATFAALLFEFAKWGFALFIANFGAYQVVYGALAALPIFLAWIYLSWVVVLLGAEFTQALESYRERRQGSLGSIRTRFILAVRILGDLYRAQRLGRALGEHEINHREPAAGGPAVGEVLHVLQKARIIRRTDRGGWMLARDPSRLTLLDVYRAHSFVLAPMPARLEDRDDWNRALAPVLGEVRRSVESTLAVSLRDIFQSDGAED